ncbi:DUF4231 domain-containing protein [Gordonibacter sp. 28C]|uniref:DUF4231 domain-containing protein n=1 Tax=Gordonibacter sp. 28C TaxID=2078569 RepID=UPI000DF78A97|nr:DUF4231 domain-containing protein [Gordonibacter sp. 28C]RDB60549.1 DUF4231 domain-containing protein [Gordonibacter sp. 28C]
MPCFLFFSKDHPSLIFYQIISLLIILVIAIYLLVSKTMAHWYSARALAESVKTLSWRFVTKAYPFEYDDEKRAKIDFCDRLDMLYKQNQELATKLHPDKNSCQLPDKMISLRARSAEDRKKLYDSSRVNDQYEWYRKKGNVKRWQYNIFSILYVLSLIVSIMFLMLGYSSGNEKQLPVDVVIAFSTSILTWIQAKRFSELVASYNQAAHDIGFISSCEIDDVTDETLAKFVSDSENAFSREHIQWFARKDN